ncbi:MAG TPA: hypothetical protein VFA71_04900 [Terriglobales bacterium]|nr:hypothetical protein [Terriglobales bacterium]
MDILSLRSAGKTIFCQRPAILAALSILLLVPAWAGDTCNAKQAALETFLSAQPNHCIRDVDCDGYYLRADSCAAPVVLAKPGMGKAREAELLKLQAQVRAACGESWSQRPACSPVPFQARCRQNRCVDAIAFPAPALQPAPTATKETYPYAVARHTCAPWDGPAVGIHLTKSKVAGREIPLPSITLSLWRQLPPPIHQPISLQSSVGVATRCLHSENCEAAIGSTITFTSYSDTSITGSYELKFKDGDVERGSFQAEWQDYHELCR